jgi:metallo-beta-lactamase family protein
VKKYPQDFNNRIRKVLENDDDPFNFAGLEFIKTVDESKLLNFSSEPCVIISASGMADAGRVKHHISNNSENSRNSILMSGYCEPHSLGAKLQSGRKEVNIYGVVHEIHAEIGSIRSMSAHGDYEDLSQFLSCQDVSKVKKLFLVHGEYDVQIDFRERLLRKGFTDIEISKVNRIYDWMMIKENDRTINTNRRDFKIFVDEHDKRRGTNFIKTFPEFEDFYNKIKV